MSAPRTFSCELETRKGTIRGFGNDEGAYVIRVDPAETKNADGSMSVSMGFPVLMLSGWVGRPEAFAKQVADLLTAHYAAQAEAVQ